MIQNRTHADRQVEGNLTGEDIKMGVGDLSHILNVLTDLYSDRELACIREYSTNAWDAHVEAGVTSPIEVTTPTALSPFLTIRDFGIGLTLDDIREIYSQYGVSTKRSTNAQNGMLGLGCKSALTYADQFTVTSVKDGVRIQVVVSRNTNGASMKVVDTSDSTEPNGTTVTIPARSGNQIASKAQEFFKFWEDGRCKLNGQATERLPGAQWVSDSLALIDKTYNSDPHYVVMGGVAYPAPNLNVQALSNSRLVAFVDIGAVDFAPSREALMDTDTTAGTLTAIVKEYSDSVKQSVLDDIASATTPLEAVQKRQAWFQKLPSNLIPTSTPYKGKPVPDGIDVPDNSIIAQYHARRMTGHSKLNKHAPMNTILNALWIVGWDHGSFTATTKKKLWKYCEDKGITYPHFILSKDKPNLEWIDGGVTLVPWQTIKEIKLPRNQPNPTTGRIPGSYDLYEDGDYNEGVPGDDIDQTNPIFWIHGNYSSGRRYVPWLKEHHPGATLVMLRRGREDKFQRLFPKAKEISEVVGKEFDAYVATITDDHKLSLAIKDDHRFSDWEEFQLSEIDDPRFAKISKLRKQSPGLQKVQDRLASWGRLGYYFNPGLHAVKNPLDDYELLPDPYYFRRYSQEKKAHVYRYINAEYAHLRAEGKV